MVTILEEVAGLLIQISANPELPFAHLAARQAALATNAIETELVALETTNLGDNLMNIPEYVSKPLNILRTIAETITPITIDDAITSGNIWLVWLMIENGAMFHDKQLFRHACALGNIDILRVILDLPLERGVNPAEKENHVLRAACRDGHTEIVRVLLDLPLERGIHPAAKDNRALWFACDKGHVEIVRLLLELPLERGVDPTVEDNFPLTISCIKGHVEIVRLLIEHGVNPTAEDNAALMLACEKGHIEIVRLLIEHGVNPTAKDNRALWFACDEGHVEIVRLLIEHGVDPTAENNAAALMLACDEGHVEMVRLLIAHGVIVRRVHTLGGNESGFFNACYSGHVDVVRLLLELPPKYGVKLSVNGEELNVASERKRTEIVRLLLTHGIYPNATKALQIAVKHGLTEFYATLTAKIPWYNRIFLNI